MTWQNYASHPHVVFVCCCLFISAPGSYYRMIFVLRSSAGIFSVLEGGIKKHRSAQPSPGYHKDRKQPGLKTRSLSYKQGAKPDPNHLKSRQSQDVLHASPVKKMTLPHQITYRGCWKLHCHLPVDNPRTPAQTQKNSELALSMTPEAKKESVKIKEAERVFF